MSTPSFPCVAGGLSVEDKEGSHQAPHDRVPCMGEEGKPCHGCVKTSTFFHKERKIMPPRPLAAFKDSDSQCPDLPTLLFSSNPDDERDGRIPARLEPGRLSTSNLLWNLRVCVCCWEWISLVFWSVIASTFTYSHWCVKLQKYLFVDWEPLQIFLQFTAACVRCQLRAAWLVLKNIKWNYGKPLFIRI